MIERVPLLVVRGDAFAVAGHYRAICRRRGKILWRDEIRNLIPDAAKNDLLAAYLAAGTQRTTWYMGLKGTGAAVAGDTSASHAGWSEITPYSQATRPAWTPGSVASKSVDNSASKAVFTINAGATVYGAFLISVSTKGGTTGILYSAGDFGSSRAVLSGDELDITGTFTVT